MDKNIFRFGTGEDDLSPLLYSKCVFTNGCFDILHRGHISLFKFCYNVVDRTQKNGTPLNGLYNPVIVGVNSDKSIKQLKGSSRPVMKEEDRLAVLSSIRWIDYVIVFDLKSVADLIKFLNPLVLVKGGNYSTKPCAKADQIVGQEYVESYGGKVITAPLIDGVSTTSIVERIRK